MPNQRRASQVPVMIYVDRDLKAAAIARAREKGETVTDVLTRALKRYSKGAPGAHRAPEGRT